METYEVKILKYSFRFRQLSWREETSIQFEKNKNRVRTLLAHALTEVSGLKVESVADAKKVLMAVPGSVLQRVFILYRGTLPMPRRFATTGLYKAPGTNKLAERLKQVEDKREKIMDKVEAEMEAKFGRRELQETLETERQMLKNSKMRGATPATPDADKFGVTPPRKRNAD